MMSDIQLTGEDILESLISEIEKAYNGTVLEKWIEQEDNGQVWLCYALKDKIGIVKVPIETGGVVDES